MMMAYGETPGPVSLPEKKKKKTDNIKKGA
jgi:hypothetical protein